MEKSVYLLEDDDGICDLVRCTLLLSDIECSTFGTVRAFEDAVAEKVPAIAVLDIMLPDGNGLDVLTRVKSRHPEVYCIMLSALGKESDKVTGLNLGADDYIAKPFGILEFSAKIAAVFRRIKKKRYGGCKAKGKRLPWWEMVSMTLRPWPEPTWVLP